jgi:sulfoquinovose isomerase
MTPLPQAPLTATMLRAQPEHQRFLRKDAARQINFFRPSLREDGTFCVLDLNGAPLPDPVQELHTTTRLIHSFALAKRAGFTETDPMIDAGMACLWAHHRDPAFGGYVWSFDDGGIKDGLKLAYGHVFVLLAAASAKLAGHRDADRLLGDVRAVIDTHFWDEDAGLLRDEFTREWEVFSTYRGMNANMHGVEAFLTAFEATGDTVYLDRAGRILDFFTGQIAPNHNWRLPEHYTESWQVDASYSGNPMFRPAGSTPGHSFELGRLLLQHWDLTGRADSPAPKTARRLIYRALEDAWDVSRGGLVYTLKTSGVVDIADRYWWPVTEAIGALAALQNLDGGTQDDEIWYQRIWAFATSHLIDTRHGGWFPELNAQNQPCGKQFIGKPDLYHALQAVFLPQVNTLSRLAEALHANAAKAESAI